ncbi:MAG: ArsR/SmtB family transcription factor [Streptomycetales bacterium]
MAQGNESDRLDGVFRALAHPARRDMLRRLSRQRHSIGELAAPYRMSFAAASKHVHVLEEVGLVRRRISGRTHLCTLNPEPLAEAHVWIRSYERFWTQRLDALEALFRAPNDADEESP